MQPVALSQEIVIRRLAREYDRAIRAEENATTLPQAWRRAAVSELCLRRLQAAQAGRPVPAPRPAPSTLVNRAKAALATLGAIGRAIGRAVQARAALAKAQAAAAARQVARRTRLSLRAVVQFVARQALRAMRAINHQTSPRGQGAMNMAKQQIGTMKVPTIHLNGTGQEYLMNSVRCAADAVNYALTAMRAVYPNARDYYPQGDGAFAAALAEHHDRVERLRSVLVELSDLGLAIADGGAR